VHLGEHRADQADHGGVVGEDPNDAGAAFDLFVHVLERVGGPGLRPVRSREGGESQHLGLRAVHQRPDLREPRRELVADVVPGRGDGLATRLEDEAEARREQAREKQAAGRRGGGSQASGRPGAHLLRARRGRRAEARGKQEAEEGAEKAASAAETQQQSAQQRAKAELEDAREDEQAADEAREDAEQLSELTAAEKQERKEN
jgi:hypothetical protein